MNFENLEIKVEDLPDFEKVEFKSISKKYLYVIFFNWTIIAIVVFTGSLIVNFFQRQLFGSYFKYILGFLVFFLILNFILSYFGFFKKKYAIRNQDVIFQSGLIKTTTIIIPFNRIQHVSLEEGWLSRVLDLKAISIFTAGQSGGDIKIPGLDNEVSLKINQLILNKIEDEVSEEKSEEKSSEIDGLETDEQSEIIFENRKDEI
ncbi:PH domain-containing protein [Frigoriflavimonas asaccharolytica]|uniref:YdbS-like PH domain-containing protein n=1 Tax=Frigoriflavimonas asaccharolytica TaxID=2735899 RepID=A0A8J8G7N2_9FLAO|nr:PH domain-containing protein [Frigoriflavimonas asaccharolytica]NRS92814.1 hypothetical protein [Frigoriflavimonas asaccharolytica]